MEHISAALMETGVFIMAQPRLRRQYHPSELYSLRSQPHALRGYHVSKLQHGAVEKFPQPLWLNGCVCMFKKKKKKKLQIYCDVRSVSMSFAAFGVKSILAKISSGWRGGGGVGCIHMQW